uniref:C2H2-type domain-containing protein n=1 Tax=Meloidogyne incognita TaxID=6306 RepID=A0A914NW31_MELIC
MGSPKQQQQLQQQQQQQQRLPPTTSIKKEPITTSIATTTNATSSAQFSPTSNIENERNLNLAQQKIVDQLLEAGGIFNSLENNLGGGNDELGQLMAQLISGSNNRNETEIQAAQLAQHLVTAATGGSGSGGDVLSPSSSQQQISLLDQLHLLQMLGGNNNALAELFSGQHFATSSGHEQQLFGSGGGGGGKFTSGGSPNKDDTYCEICNKNLCNRYFLKIHMSKKHGIGGER